MLSPTLNDLHSFAVSVARLGRGLIAVRPVDIRPRTPLVLYDMEGCPSCRKVREVLSELDLAYISRPCARGSAVRDELAARGGKVQLPYLVDADGGVERYGSEAIIDHLYATWSRPRPWLCRVGAPVSSAASALASVLRRRGVTVRPGCERRVQPAERLILYSFEASPFYRKVREALHELNIEALVVNVAKRSPTRPELVARGGKMQVPYLIDPGTGRELYESDDIIRYLEETYAP
ncbi:MAG: glutathione S-transferase [Proteobacteria bacterium]|nr:MAG: glutathione S-transferase [Pseudomonadota bacterium]